MQRARRTHKAFEFFLETGEHASAVWEVRKVILECGKACHDLAVDGERGHVVRNLLFGIGNDFQNAPAHLLERLALRLGEGGDVRVDVCCAHSPILPTRLPTDQTVDF